MNIRAAYAKLLKHPKLSHRLKMVGGVLAFYVLMTLIFIPKSYVSNTGVPFITVVRPIVIAFSIWAALTPLIFWLGGRLPVESPTLLRNLALHLPLSIIVGFVHTVSFFSALNLFSQQPLMEALRARILNEPANFYGLMSNGCMFYMINLILIHATNYFRRYKDREFRLQQAQLNLLKMQLHPHFLFNTLNAISALVYESQETAARTISQLSDMLRLSLNRGAAHEVSLKDELEFLRKYVQIQQTLLQERLEVRWDIEPGALDALVPNMILQPIVENSIRHGIAPLENGGRIEVSARRFDGRLRLSVCDNGIGLAEVARERGLEGVGLGNTRARLKHLYGGAHHLSFNKPRGGGLEVRLLIPFRECPAQD